MQVAVVLVLSAWWLQALSSAFKETNDMEQKQIHGNKTLHPDAIFYLAEYPADIEKVCAIA